MLTAGRLALRFLSDHKTSSAAVSFNANRGGQKSLHGYDADRSSGDKSVVDRISGLSFVKSMGYASD